MRPSPSAPNMSLGRCMLSADRLELEDRLQQVEEKWREKHVATCCDYRRRLAGMHELAERLADKYDGAKARIAALEEQQCAMAREQDRMRSVIRRLERELEEGGRMGTRVREGTPIPNCPLQPRPTLRPVSPTALESRCAQELEERLRAERASLEQEFASRCTEHLAMVREEMRSAAERKLRAALLERLKPVVMEELRCSLSAAPPRRRAGSGKPHLTEPRPALRRLPQPPPARPGARGMVRGQSGVL